jgi:hypothetical protein
MNNYITYWINIQWVLERLHQKRNHIKVLIELLNDQLDNLYVNGESSELIITTYNSLNFWHNQLENIDVIIIQNHIDFLELSNILSPLIT